MILIDALFINKDGRGGLSWLDSMFHFLSGASQWSDYAAVSRSGCRSTPLRASSRQALGAASSGYRLSGTAPLPDGRR